MKNGKQKSQIKREIEELRCRYFTYIYVETLGIQIQDLFVLKQNNHQVRINKRRFIYIASHYMNFSGTAIHRTLGLTNTYVSVLLNEVRNSVSEKIACESIYEFEKIKFNKTI